MLFHIMYQILVHGCMQFNHKILKYTSSDIREVDINKLDEVISKKINERVKRYYNYKELPNNLNVLYNMLKYSFFISFDEVKESYTFFKNVEVSKIDNRYIIIEKDNYLDIFKMLYKLDINPEKRLSNLDFMCIIKDIIVSRFNGMIEEEYIDLRQEENVYNLYLVFDKEVEIKIESFDDLSLRELDLEEYVYSFPVNKIMNNNQSGIQKFKVSSKGERYIYIVKNDMYEDYEGKNDDILKQALYINSMDLAEYNKLYEDFNITLYYVEK